MGIDDDDGDYAERERNEKEPALDGVRLLQNGAHPRGKPAKKPVEIHKQREDGSQSRKSGDHRAVAAGQIENQWLCAFGGKAVEVHQKEIRINLGRIGGEHEAQRRAP